MNLKVVAYRTEEKRGFAGVIQNLFAFFNFRTGNVLPKEETAPSVNSGFSNVATPPSDDFKWPYPSGNNSEPIKPESPYPLINNSKPAETGERPVHQWPPKTAEPSNHPYP